MAKHLQRSHLKISVNGSWGHNLRGRMWMELAQERVHLVLLYKYIPEYLTVYNLGYRSLIPWLYVPTVPLKLLFPKHILYTAH
jgi:hypothetical protein